MRAKNNPRSAFALPVLLATAVTLIVFLTVNHGIAPAHDSQASRVFLPLVDNAPSATPTPTPTSTPTLVSVPSTTPMPTVPGPFPATPTGSRLGVWLGGGGDRAVDLLQRTGAK